MCWHVFNGQLGVCSFIRRGERRERARSEGTAPSQGVIENEDDDRAKGCDHKTPGVKAGYAWLA